MDNLREEIEAIINRHALKAQSSAYDRDVHIMAIHAARKKFHTITHSSDPALYVQKVINCLDELAVSYCDFEGIHTCGRSAINSLRDDVYSRLKDRFLK